MCISNINQRCLRKNLSSLRLQRLFPILHGKGSVYSRTAIRSKQTIMLTFNIGPRLYREFSRISFICYFVIPASTGGQAHFESNISVKSVFKIFLRHFLLYGGSSTEQKTFLGSHSYWETCYQVTCSVLGQLESFRNYLRPQYHFPENFRCNFRFYESENFSDSSLHRIFESENFRFPFSTKNRLTWGLKCEN